MSHSALRMPRIAALATALAAVTVAAATPSASAAATPRLKVLSYNVFLMSKNLYPNWGQDHRAQAIVAADFFQGQDVVVLQEAFDNSSSETLKSRATAQYPHQTPVVGRSRGGWDATGRPPTAVPATLTPSTPRRTPSRSTATRTTPARTWTTSCSATAMPVPPDGRTPW